MIDQHPITPPPELLDKWDNLPLRTKDIFVVAAQWGADQELETCCEWLAKPKVALTGKGPGDLRAARRPKPPTLKEQALADLHEIYTSQPFPVGDKRFNRIRRALEALND